MVSRVRCVDPLSTRTPPVTLNRGQGLDAAWREARSAREVADAEERLGAQAAARADGEWTQAVARLAELQAPERDISAITSDLAAAEGELASLCEGPDFNATQLAMEAARLQVASTLAALTAARDHHAKADKSATSMLRRLKPRWPTCRRNCAMSPPSPGV